MTPQEQVQSIFPTAESVNVLGILRWLVRDEDLVYEIYHLLNDGPEWQVRFGSDIGTGTTLEEAIQSFDAQCEVKFDQLRQAQNFVWSALYRAQAKQDPMRMLPDMVEWEKRGEYYYGDIQGAFVVARYDEPTWTIACYTSYEGAIAIIGDPQFSQFWGQGKDPRVISRQLLVEVLKLVFASMLGKTEF